MDPSHTIFYKKSILKDVKYNDIKLLELLIKSIIINPLRCDLENILSGLDCIHSIIYLIETETT